jgi:hypothetical protein
MYVWFEVPYPASGVGDTGNSEPSQWAWRHHIRHFRHILGSTVTRHIKFILSKLGDGQSKIFELCRVLLLQVEGLVINLSPSAPTIRWIGTSLAEPGVVNTPYLYLSNS